MTWQSLGVPQLPPLSPGQSGGSSVLRKPLVAAPAASSPALCRSPPVSPQPHSPSCLSRQLLHPLRLGQNPPPGPVNRVHPQLPPLRRPPGHTQIPLPTLWLFPVAPCVPWPHSPHPAGGDTGHSPAGSAGRGFPPGSSWRWRGFSSAPVSSGRTWWFLQRPSPCPRRPLARHGRGAGLLLTPPATFAGENCQEGACDAALFPHQLCRQT